MNVEKANERNRAHAIRAGRDTFQLNVIDTWPACTTCGTPIRRNIETGRPGHYRACGCEGVVWWCGPCGWQRDG